MLNLIYSVLQQECKQESENLDKGRVTGTAPPGKKLPLPLNGGRSHAFSFLDLGRSAFDIGNSSNSVLHDDDDDAPTHSLGVRTSKTAELPPPPATHEARSCKH